MLTYEKVLEVFSDHLSQDPLYEVVMTSRGYTVMGWDKAHDAWEDVRFCGTPEALRDKLLDVYRSYLEEIITRGRGLGHEDVTEQEAADIRAKLNVLLEKCQA